MREKLANRLGQVSADALDSIAHDGGIVIPQPDEAANGAVNEPTRDRRRGLAPEIPSRAAERKPENDLLYRLVPVSETDQREQPSRDGE